MHSQRNADDDTLLTLDVIDSYLDELAGYNRLIADELRKLPPHFSKLLRPPFDEAGYFLNQAGLELHRLRQQHAAQLEIP